jgi:hypothetical protein
MTDERLVYDGLAVAGAILAMYVMQKADHDRRSKQNDPEILRQARRIAFILAASFLCFSVIYDGWEVSLPVILLLGSNVVLLSINALSLKFRDPPRNGSGVTPDRSPARNLAYYADQLISAFRASRR